MPMRRDSSPAVHVPAPWSSSSPWNNDWKLPSAHGRATIFEILSEAHQLILQKLRTLKTTDDDSTRQRLLQEIAHAIEFHERFEETAFYPLICKYTDDPTLTHASHEHDKIRRLLAQLLLLDRGTRNWSRLLKDLTDVVDHHVKNEEKKLFPAIYNIIDARTARNLGREYDQMSDVTIRVPTVVNNIITGLPDLLKRSIEIGIDNISCAYFEQSNAQATRSGRCVCSTHSTSRYRCGIALHPVSKPPGVYCRTQ